MANYELAIVFSFLGIIATLFYLARAYGKDGFFGQALSFFFTVMNVYLIWMLAGFLYALADANTAPANILSGLGDLYWVVQWGGIVFIILLFLKWLFMDILGMFGDLANKGRMS